MKKAIAAGALLAAILLLLWLWPARTASHSEDLAIRPARVAIPTSTRAASADTARTTVTRRVPPEAAPREPPSPRAASLIEQLIAIHAIASQADVSAYLEHNAELAAERIDAFCAEAKKLPPAPLLRESPHLRDAAPYLGPRVDWNAPPRSGSLHLPEDVAERADAEGWLDAITPSDVAPVDFGWLRELAAFDHWSLAPRQPAPGEPFDAVIELPDYLQFRRWARLRFHQALRSGDLLQASSEVRHLADLLYDQGFVLAVQYAAMLLEVERSAYELARARGLNVDGWTPASAEDLKRFRRLDRVAYGFLMPGVDPEISRRALTCVPSPCSALLEGAWAHVTVGEFAPRSTTDEFWTLPSSNCSAGLLRQIRGAEGRSAEEAKEMLSDASPLERPF